MASHDDLVRMWLFEEQRPLTYSWLASELALPSNVAKQLLYTFGTKYQDQVKSTFLISGTRQGSSGHAIQLVPETTLERAKSEFSHIKSLHVYSLQTKLSSKTSKILWRNDYEQRKSLMMDEGHLGDAFRANGGSSIANGNVQYNKRALSSQSLAPAEVAGTSSTSSTKPMQNSAARANKTGKPAAAASFFGKAAGKGSGDQQKKKKKKKNGPKSPAKTGFNKLFGQKRKSPQSSGGSETQPLTMQSSANSSGSTEPAHTESDRPKKRRVITAALDSESDSDDDGETAAAAAAAAAGVGPAPPLPATGSSSSARIDAPGKENETHGEAAVASTSAAAAASAAPAAGGEVAAAPGARKVKKTKIKKVQKKRTYQDEQGYFVTESIYVDVEVTDDEEEEPIRPAPVKSSSAGSQKKATKPAGKQGSLFGFFKKKKKKN